MYLYGTSPRRDSPAFVSLITRYKAMLQNRNVSPEAAFADTNQVTLANYHYRARPLTNALIDEINFDKAISVYKDRFADFSDFIFFSSGTLKLILSDSLLSNILLHCHLSTEKKCGRMSAWTRRKAS